jgi:hypothetical protein
MPTVRQISAVFDGTAGQGLLATEPYLPPETEAFRVVSFRISLFVDGVAPADISSQIVFQNEGTGATETLLFAPTILAGSAIAWDFPCDLISPRDTEIAVTVSGPLPSPGLLLWDFQISAPTRAGGS